MASVSHDQVDESKESADVAGTAKPLEETAVQAPAAGGVVPSEVGMPSAVAQGQGEPNSSKKKKRGFSLPKLFGWDKAKPRSGVENESPAASGEQPSTTAPPAVGDPVTVSGEVPAAELAVTTGGDGARVATDTVTPVDASTTDKATVAVDGSTARDPEGSVATTASAACERASDAIGEVLDSIQTAADQIAPDEAKNEETGKPSSAEVS